MKGLRTLKRYFRDSIKSVIRNFSLSLASVSCITITLIVVAVSIVISSNVDNFTQAIRKDVTIVVFLDNDTTSSEVDEVKDKLKSIKNIDDIQFKSKKEAAEEAKVGNDIFGTVIDGWTDETNPLLDSFMLKVKDVEKIKENVNQIKSIEKVNTVNYGEEIVDQLITVFKVVEKISIGAVIALIIVTAFLIANTIKLAIFSRKTEIEIMRLVGASNISIKVPFIIEGLFLGAIGSIIPIIISIYGYITLYDFFEGKLFSSSLAKLIEPTPFVYTTSLLLLGIGMLVGMFGSWRAVKKYLKI